MALQTFLFNSTDGTTVTTGNSGALSIATGTGSTQIYKTSAAYQGTTGLEVVSTGATSALRYQFTGAASATQAAFSIRLKVPSTIPSAGTSFLQVNDTAAAKVLTLLYTAGGSIAIYDKSNTSNVLLSAGQATAGSWFRVEIVVSTLSTTAGAFTGRAYNSSNTQVGSTVNVTNGNTGTTAMGGAYVGIVQAGVTLTEDLDNFQMNAGATSEIGEYATNTTPPTITAGANQTISNAGSSVNLTASATAAGGSAGIASYSWTCTNYPPSLSGAPTITNATTSAASFTPTAFGRYIFSVTATDVEGNTSGAATTKVFLPTTPAAVIAVTSSTGGWTGTYDLTGDSSDSTYIESSAPTSTVANERLRLAPLPVPSGGATFSVRLAQTGSGNTCVIGLYEGSTLRKSWTQAVTSTITTYSLTLTSGEVATITSWNELDLDFGWST